MDAATVVSLFLCVQGIRYAYIALRILRSKAKEVRAIEDSIVFYKNSPFTRTDSRRALLIVGLFFYVHALDQYITPNHPPFSGRLSWLYAPIYQYFGPNGLVLLTVAFATVLLFYAAYPTKHVVSAF